MGFMEHPYRNITIHIDDYDNPSVICSSCGGERELTENADIEEIKRVNSKHLAQSHNVGPEDFEDWSEY